MTWETFLSARFRDWQRLEKSFRTLEALEAASVTSGPLWDQATKEWTNLWDVEAHADYREACEIVARENRASARLFARRMEISLPYAREIGTTTAKGWRHWLQEAAARV